MIFYLVTQSEDYVFFPDSMNTYAQFFNLPRTVSEAEFPPLSKNIYEHWEPYNEVLWVQSGDDLVKSDSIFICEVYLIPDI